jgi:sec-independent protein translocase protein TatC
MNPVRSLRNIRIRKKNKKVKPPAGQMTFLEHLGELRGRLIWSCLAIVVGTSFGFIFSRDLVDIFISLKRYASPDTDFINTQLAQGFTVYFQVSIFAGLLLSSPVIVYQLIAFLAPALEPENNPGDSGYEVEMRWIKSVKRIMIITIPMIVLFFAGGVLFCYYIVVPPAVHFLTTFPQGQFRQTLTVPDFVNTISKILFWTGIIFEIPIMMFALAKLKIVSWKKFLSWWKFAIVISLVISALVNPSPEPVMQILIAGPVMGLYLLGVLFARFAVDKNVKPS